MKKLARLIIAPLLLFFARAVIRRYRPKIVMVTGSVGKTSTKDAVATVLQRRYFVRASEKSFNGEFGVPFTVLGVGNPWHNPLAWLSLIKSGLALLLLPNHYPNMLVLEVGADKPGDLAKILKIATPDAVVVTRLPEISVHVEAYSSPDAVREEEFSPANALGVSAPLIISADDPYALEFATQTPAKIITYGTTADAMVRVSDFGFYDTKGNVAGMRADVNVCGERKSCVVKGSVGKTQLYPVAAALSVACAFEIPMVEALSALEAYEPPPGRGRLLAGKHGTIIIDDSYNSSPAAVEEALATLKAFPRAKRRIAILGDMLELGRYSVTEHGRIGELAHQSADVVVAVGIRARAFASAQDTAETMLFDNSKSAALALPALLREGDVILVKGSQSIRMERVVCALLNDVSDECRTVRQEEKWKQKA